MQEPRRHSLDTSRTMRSWPVRRWESEQMRSKCSSKGGFSKVEMSSSLMITSVLAERLSKPVDMPVSSERGASQHSSHMRYSQKVWRMSSSKHSISSIRPIVFRWIVIGSQVLDQLMFCHWVIFYKNASKEQYVLIHLLSTCIFSIFFDTISVAFIFYPLWLLWIISGINKKPMRKS